VFNASVISSVDSLYNPWEEPNSFRSRSDKEDGKAVVKRGRRRSSITVVQNLRDDVREWRETGYPGASDTTIQLLNYWFERSHRRTSQDGVPFEFRYYFCQREAIETFVFLKEVRGVNTLSQLIGDHGGVDRELLSLGIPDDEDVWARYAFKLATGTGKTKVMTLAIAWSYFHAQRESDSPMARHFVVVAPNLTVFERLKMDFVDDDIFLKDPIVPPELRGDWNMSVVLQSEASGAATGGVIYLTNIHQLYDPKKRGNREPETYAWAGPSVSKSKALDTGQLLRDRITSHRRLMVLNDEAHHIWDPDSAWAEAISFMDSTLKQKYGSGLVAQLDFTATPKDNHGRLFKHIICDTPLGEAVDAGIVKTPIIGRSEQKLHEEASDDAAYRYDRHLRLGYERWKKSVEEWQGSGKKPLLFVMCEDTEAANQIAQRLNTDPAFETLNGSTINLHTNLKGKIVRKGRGENARQEFVESEKEISDEDLRFLRKLSRELDSNASPYSCIVSVLMLREGWDVRNVTTIVPLRPYSSKANILPEQTLGRGLRRMTPAGPEGAHEVVVVVEHEAFVNLYKEELAQEGLFIDETEVQKIEATTVTIFPDRKNKDVDVLEIEIPRLSGGYSTKAQVDDISLGEIKDEFVKYSRLPLAEKVDRTIQYEGRHLFTGEVVERMEIHIELLKSGMGAVSYYVKQLEHICKVRNLHTKIAPLLQTFFEEMLFTERVTLFEDRLIVRLGDDDVQESVRAVFVPLIRNKVTVTQERLPLPEPVCLSQWKPFQATHGTRKRAMPGDKTLFNLVPCENELEVAMNRFLDRAPDIVAFAKNAGPQCLRIDYLAQGQRLAYYTPDFFARGKDGIYWLIETKGRVDLDVPTKAKAALAWCDSASSEGVTWKYLYVPQGVFESHSGNTIEELAAASDPALRNLIDSESLEERFPLLAPAIAAEDEEEPDLGGLVDAALLNSLNPRDRKAVRDAVVLFLFMENKQDMNFAPAFSPLLGPLDDAARFILRRHLEPEMPDTVTDQKAWFFTGDRFLSQEQQRFAGNLKKTLVFNGGFSPIGLLRGCLDFANGPDNQLGGVFAAVNRQFEGSKAKTLLKELSRINSFRNTYVAHQNRELVDAKIAKEELLNWISTLKLMTDYMTS